MALQFERIDEPAPPRVKQIECDIPYTPRPEFVPYHERTQRFSKIVAHRRFGKTVGTLNDLIKRALLNTRQQPPPSYAYIGPTYTQAKDVAWSYLKYYTSQLPMIERSESELWVKLTNGARIRIYGADNYDRIRGLLFDGVVIDEPAQQDPRAWPEVIRPTLSDFSGWATFIGTPAGRNWFYQVGRTSDGVDLDPDWFHLNLPASQTMATMRAHKVAQGEAASVWDNELESARSTLTPEQYAQEYETSFEAAVMGAYYGRLMADAEREKRICGVPYDPAVRVYTAWDLGIGDNMAIWWAQVVGREIHLIDYYENSGLGLDHYVREIRQRPYVYVDHILPFDAEARELGTGKTRVEVLDSLGLKPITIATRHEVEDGINAVRTMLPKCWFDARRCARGVDALKLYRAEYDDKLQTLRQRPVHDWCFTGDTEILTRYGTYPIKALPNRGEVLTPCGWKPYHSPRVTRRNARLVEVRFTDGHSVRCTPDHMFMTESGWKSAASLTTGTLIQSSLMRSRSISMAAFTVFGQVKDTTRAAARSFIGMLGSLHSVRFPRAATSTIGTLTQQTIAWPIWNAFQQANISRLLMRTPDPNAYPLSSEGLTGHLSVTRISHQPHAKLQRHGTNQKLVGFGIGDTLNAKRVGLLGSVKNVRVISAVRSLMHWCAKAVMPKNSVVPIAKPLTIVSVNDLSETADVWCLTVPGEAAFSLANGAIVHNCSHPADAFRYMAMMLDRKVIMTGFNRKINMPRLGVA